MIFHEKNYLERSVFPSSDLLQGVIWREKYADRKNEWRATCSFYSSENKIVTSH